MSQPRPAGGKIFTVPFIIGIIIILIALYFVIQRLIFGLGPVTGMNDGYPWGLWIAYDVNVGTAFACGGYAMAILIYIFNRGEFSPLLRPAILTSMFGYILGGLSVAIDIGRYWNMHHIILPKYANVHSVLLEVALCIGAYCLVLLIEFAPTVFKKLNYQNIQKNLNRVLFIFVALGILLPTMHQSSLGSLMVLAGSKLSPLWWSKMLPLFFLVAALLLGYAIVIFETVISSLTFNNTSELRLLSKLSGVIPWVIALFLALRFQDLIARDALALALKGDVAGNMFLLENILLVLALILLIPSANRRNPRMIFLAALSLLFGAGLYRFSAYIIGFNPGNGWHYFPTAPEILITFGIISVEILGYLWIVKRFPVLHMPEKS